MDQMKNISNKENITNNINNSNSKDLRSSSIIKEEKNVNKI